LPNSLKSSTCNDPNDDPNDDVIVAGTWAHHGVWASSLPQEPLWSLKCWDARGITVDNDHNLWVACSGGDFVAKVKVNAATTPHYSHETSIVVGQTPTGMAVDGNSK
jgi:DNA-binding beta-propeller fold protein YncE